MTFTHRVGGMGVQVHEEEWLAGQLEEGSKSESQTSITSDPDIDAMNDNLRLPGIQTLGLWGLKAIAARQPDPPDRIVATAAASSSRLNTLAQDTESRETAQHQLPPQSAQTHKVPEQDTPCDTQGESREVNHERGCERNEGRDSASLQIKLVHFDNDGKQFKPKISDLTKSRRKKHQGRERKRSRNSKALRMVFVQYGKKSTVKHD